VSTAPLGETDEERHERFVARFNAAATAFNAFREAVDSTSPFYPEDIHAALGELIRVGIRDQVQMETSEPFSSRWYDQGEANRVAVRGLAETVSDMIRKRIASLTIYDAPPRA
jgi:hypothetical protein